MFAADLSGCPACGGRLRIVAALTDPASIRTCLEGVGLPAPVSRTEECALKYRVDP